MWKCKHCQKKFENLLSYEKANHSRWCNENPKKKEYIDKLKNTRNKATKESRKKQSKTLAIAWKNGKFENVDFGKFKGKTHSEESKKKISNGLKKLMKMVFILDGSI